MRSLAPRRRSCAPRAGRVLAVSLLSLTTACEWITGVPSVDRVELSVTPPTLVVQRRGRQANVTVYGNDDKIVSRRRRSRIGYSSDNSRSRR